MTKAEKRELAIEKLVDVTMLHAIWGDLEDENLRKSALRERESRASAALDAIDAYIKAK